MKRRLKRGIPFGNNLPTIPEPVHLCECYDCLNSTCTDPTTGFPIKGRLLTPREIRRHEMLAQKKAIASAKLNIAAIGLPVPVFDPPEPKTLSHVTSGPADIPLDDQWSNNPSTSTALPNLGASIPYKPTLYSTASRNPRHEGQRNQLAIDNILISLRNTENLMKSQPPYNTYMSIVFSTPPTAHSQPLNETFTQEETDRIWSLKPGVPANSQLLSHQEWLYRTREFIIESNRDYGHLSTALRLKCVALQRVVDRELVAIEASLKSEWERQRWIARNAPEHCVDMNPYMSRSLMAVNSFTLASYLVTLVLHLLCGLSIAHCKFLLGAHEIMSGIDANSTIAYHPPFKPVLDVRTVEKIIKLDTPSDSFVCCPKCYYLYPYHRDGDGLFVSVPERCGNRPHPDSEPCSRRLRRPKKIGKTELDRPIREFHYQSMKHWVAWMVSRPEIEKALDEDPTARQESTTFGSSDIWHGTALRNFFGPDGSEPFYQGPGNEARLIFSLNMDGFNPYTNKEAGKKVSTGGIYMVCLNLPASIRHKEQNIYLVGIIPGPQEPSQHEINYLLKPLVDELLQFWDPGFYFSHTSSHPQGRWIRCAVVPLVCDLPAARQMSGNAHHGATNFCSYCWQTLANINDLDYKSWDVRTGESHRDAAQAWLDAGTHHERKALRDGTGVRWSELLRLPYWNPVEFTVIDPMHCFYLRMLSRHCRDIWGMDDELPDATTRRRPNDPSAKEVKHAQDILRRGTSAQLKALKVAVLRELCIEISVNARGRKETLLARLSEHRRQKGWPVRSPKDGVEELNEEAKHLFRFATKSKMRSLSKAELVRIHQVNLGGVDGALNNGRTKTAVNYGRMKTAQLHSAIQAARKEENIIDDIENVLVPPAKAPKATAVLGEGVLRQVALDMRNTNLPSWVPPGPRHPGAKKWGKLTASNWCTLGLVHLPITLIRLWGNEPPTSRKRQMLDNYMHLVAAIKIGTQHSVSPQSVHEYQEHMHAYLTTLLELYPKTSISPYQHLALHFGSFLERFGPSHGWHCFPFERYNHKMQQIPTNNKFGEMEKTMFHRFRLTQLIRSYFNTASLPASLSHLVKLYHQIFSFDEASVTTLMDEALPQDNVVLNANDSPDGTSSVDRQEVPLPAQSYTLLRDWLGSNSSVVPGDEVSSFVIPHRCIIRRGQKFTTASVSSKDSYVLFKPTASSSNKWVPGRIEQIFSHTVKQNDDEVTQTFAVLSAFDDIPKIYGKHDPYRLYPAISHRLCSEESNTQVIIPVSDIICHFGRVIANLKVGSESLSCMLAYPLTS